MSIENMLARLTAQTNWKDNQMPGGGKPELTAADISVIAAQAPHMSFHALMAKNCDDAISAKELLIWVRETSLVEWFSNDGYASIRFEARQLKRLCELAMQVFINPNHPDGQTQEARAAFVGVSHDTFKRSFQVHYAYLLQELGYLEQVGERAVREFMRDDS